MIALAPPNIADMHSVVVLRMLLYANSSSLLAKVVVAKIKGDFPFLLSQRILNAFSFASSRK